jgi:hypothetical protein
MAKSRKRESGKASLAIGWWLDFSVFEVAMFRLYRQTWQQVRRWIDWDWVEPNRERKGSAISIIAGEKMGK